MRLLCLYTILALTQSVASASDLDEFKVKREESFEFTEKPTVARAGDKITISFTSKAYCDATVAIEDATGKILRHLASGVIGPNVPEPFQKNSLKQVVVWDGKNDKGEYVDDKDSLTVRVSLGLKPQFERNLFYSPYKRGGYSTSIICPTEKGVYVYGHYGAVEYVRLHDHEGNCVRTIYPFPAGALENIKGLTYQTFLQDGAKLPLKRGHFQATFLTSGHEGAGGPATAMAVHDRMVYVVGDRVNRLAGEGSRQETVLSGPEVAFPCGQPTTERRPMTAPSSAAISPDGAWLYLTGYHWSGGYGRGFLNCVVRMRPDGEKEPEVLVGDTSWARYGAGTAGSDNAHFNVPLSVDCDSKGRVYVADHRNNRVQIFDPDGKYLKTIPVTRPCQVMINRKTDEVYVLSFASHWLYAWDAGPPPTALYRFGSFDNTEQIAAYPLSLPLGASWMYLEGPTVRAALDYWTAPPTIWLCVSVPKDAGRGGGWRRFWGIQHLVEKDRKLVVLRDWAPQVAQQLARLYPAHHGRQRMYFNPADETLHVGEATGGAGKAFKETVQIDPRTGKCRIVDLPFDCEDMAFDMEGRAYLRTENFLARYDSRTWREVPFDYGEERREVAFEGWDNGRTAHVVSGIAYAGVKSCWFHQGGMDVSPKGHIVVSCCNPETPVDLRRGDRVIKQFQTKKYTPRIFPGRNVAWDVHVFDERGNVLYEDALPGVGMSYGTFIDRDDNLYTMTLSPRHYDGKPYFNSHSCVAFKGRPQATKVLLPNASPIRLEAASRPARGRDFDEGWIENALWFYGGVGGTGGGGKCICWDSRGALDYFARSFLPETDHYSVAALDANGNLILRIGRYGNADDGIPLIKDETLPAPRPLGGDEVALFRGAYLATHTDRRLFIADIANQRIVSVKLGYSAEERIPLRDVPDRKDK